MTSITNEEKIRNNHELYEIESWEDEKLDLNNNVLRGIYSFGFEKPSSNINLSSFIVFSLLSL